MPAPGIEDGIDAKFVQSAIYSGNTWGLYWQFPGIFEGRDETPAAVRQVFDILGMWTVIETSYQRLSADDKERIEADEDSFVVDARFRGFDGNDEAEQMGIARFIVEDLGRFTNFKGRELNSHVASLEAYERMLTIFLPLRSSLGANDLTAMQIIELLKGQIHPERRESQPNTSSMGSST